MVAGDQSGRADERTRPNVTGLVEWTGAISPGPGAFHDVAVVGDWNGDVRDDIGTFQAFNATWMLRFGAFVGTSGCRGITVWREASSAPYWRTGTATDKTVLEVQ